MSSLDLRKEFDRKLRRSLTVCPETMGQKSPQVRQCRRVLTHKGKLQRLPVVREVEEFDDSFPTEEDYEVTFDRLDEHNRGWISISKLMEFLIQLDGNNEIDYDEFRDAMFCIVAALKEDQEKYSIPPY
ncbi:hypothetical protein KIPB_009080 [Kipferlia bialata]|uniref:EF-hand domain-containing protein n=1 Tax=Kipferlia bialata TaxID=797122 RepID=A0A9K3D1Q2_9EUKA|nr:hypothetical protein KIPB_009080 [Kipferlia bialata]|eukprot:g9080.t1